MGALKVIDIPEDRPVLSLELPAQTSFDEWVAIGRRLCLGSQAINWHIGDWWAFGNHRYGARAKVAAEGIFEREFQTLMNTASVCRSFPTSRRREGLSFSHHAEVASLDPKTADALLDRAEGDGWSRNDLRRNIQSAQSQRQRPVSDNYLIEQKTPEIAMEIAAEAERLGKKLGDFLAFLLALGWQQYLATKDGG
jgi:hypothetical protein